MQKEYAENQTQKGEMLMEFSSADFMELSVQDVSDLLLEDISPDKCQAGALLYGKSIDGRRFKLSLVLELDQ